MANKNTTAYSMTSDLIRLAALRAWSTLISGKPPSLIWRCFDRLS